MLADQTVFTVFWGLVVVAVAALARFFRNQLLRLSKAAAKRLPEPLQSKIRRSADRRYPSWRAKAGESRTQSTLEWRIVKIREARQANYHIVGAVYLDVFVRPVATRSLDDIEYSNLEEVRDDCGGSACYVGRFLKSNFMKRSYLYTQVGGSGPLTRLLKEHLAMEETWNRGGVLKTDPTAPSAVSVHMIQPHDEYHSTFTFKGALVSLSWDKVLPALRKKSRRGGILHISGYFRTGLDNGLTWSLLQLPINLLTCIDHGRFVPDDVNAASKSLLEAFSAKAIDIYICTYPELRRLMEQGDAMVADEMTIDVALKHFSSRSLLPRVAVVRCDPEPTLLRAFVLVDREVHVVERTTSSDATQFRIGVSNAFNASLLYHLSVGDPAEDFHTSVCEAVGDALDTLRRNL